jgi:hypothetical protein
VINFVPKKLKKLPPKLFSPLIFLVFAVFDFFKGAVKPTETCHLYHKENSKEAPYL